MIISKLTNLNKNDNGDVCLVLICIFVSNLIIKRNKEEFPLYFKEHYSCELSSFFSSSIDSTIGVVTKDSSTSISFLEIPFLSKIF